MIKKNEFIIFLHIQKTGGITLQRLLRRKLGNPLFVRAYELLNSSKELNTLEKVLQSKSVKDRYFAGHVCFGVHRLLPQPCTYITILREPVSRLVSLYHFSRSNPTSYYHKFAQDKSLEDFLLRTQLMELDNGLVRFLAGDEQDLFINRTPIGKCDKSLLDLAKYNLDEHFSFVGLLEKYDQSVLLLSALMEWDRCLYIKRNVRKKSAQEYLPEALKEKIVERNHLDIKLYEHAKLRFERDLKKYGLNDLETVGKFQAKNALFNRFFCSSLSDI
jgi:hypothetical protein